MAASRCRTSQLSLPADIESRRDGLARPARLRAGTSAADRARTHRYARLHLRARQNGQSQPRAAEVTGVGPEVDPLREVRLKDCARRRKHLGTNLPHAAFHPIDLIIRLQPMEQKAA